LQCYNNLAVLIFYYIEKYVKNCFYLYSSFEIYILINFYWNKVLYFDDNCELLKYINIYI
jgi:hypothetical protein